MKIYDCFTYFNEDLILDLREGQSLGLQGSIIPEIIRPDTVWSCLQCNACVEVCPVGIEIVPIINLLRRGMVETGEIENSLKAALTAIQNIIPVLPPFLSPGKGLTTSLTNLFRLHSDL